MTWHTYLDNCKFVATTWQHLSVHVLMSMCQNAHCTVVGLCQMSCLQRRSLQREAHYVDLEAQPAAGAGQADLRHILPDSNIETAEKQAESTSESQSSSSASTTLNPAANMPIKAKSAKAKEAKQPAKAESVSPSLSMQDLAASIVHQVNPKFTWQCTGRLALLSVRHDITSLSGQNTYFVAQLIVVMLLYVD